MTTLTPAPELKSSASAFGDRGVTPRVVFLCLLLAAVFGVIIPIIDVKLANTFLGATHLPPGAIGVLLVIMLVVNPLLGLLSAKAKLTRNESLVVYLSCLFSCLVCGHGSETGFVSNILGPFYFASRENGWMNLLGPNLKPWFTPALIGPDALLPGGNPFVQNWYNGVIMGNTFIPWGAWLVSLLAWGSLIAASYAMLACVSVILRAQWAGHEALAFPLLQLPIEMTETEGNADGRAFLKNSLTWTGFGVAAVIQLVRGLNAYFPEVPTIPLELDLGPMFSEAPWNQMGWTPLNVYPVAVGITYLLTSEVSFSLWAFYWIIKFEYVAAYLTGNGPALMPAMVGNTSHKIFTGMQVTGAYFAYVGFVLWTARHHLCFVMNRALGRSHATDSERLEALSYPAAFWGFFAALTFCVGWSIAAGISPLIALWIWTAYLVISIGLTRVIAEGGLLFVQQGWVPLGAWAHLFGAGPGTALTTSSIVPGSFLQAGLMTDMRGFLMPSFMQSFKLAYDRGIAARPLLALIAGVTLIGLSLGVLMNVHLGYQSGGLGLEWWFAKGAPQENANNIAILAGGMSGNRAPGIATWSWFLVGMAVTVGTMMLRARLPWFPLHPVGYLVCLSYAMNRLWFSIFLGWFAKQLITRYGGADNYRRARPLFLGLALGDVAAMLFWLAIDFTQGRTWHQLMPS